MVGRANPLEAASRRLFHEVRSLLLACAAALAGCSSEDARPPHVLLLTVDTLRPDYLDQSTSPFLSELLAEAFHFPKAVTVVPRTTPALASMLTGAYPHTTGVRRLADSLRPDVVTLAEVLKREGWQTLAVVTNSMLGRARKLSRGFDIYNYARDTRHAAQTTDAALTHLEGFDPRRPILLWVHYIDPHMPYQTHPDLARRMDPEYSGRYALNFGEHRQRRPGAAARHGPYPEDLPKAIAVHHNPLPEAVNEHIRRLYAADIRYADDHMRRLVEGVRHWAGEEPLIVFTADHAESLGEHDFYWDHGDYVYDAASRIPLAVLVPPAHPARGSGRHDDWVSIVDVTPTVLDLIGVPVPADIREQIEGRTLAPAMRGGELAPVPVFVESGKSHFFEHVRGRATNDVAGRFRAVYTSDWKLIWAPGHGDDALSWQLYNLASDPREEKNLFAREHPEFRRLRDLLVPRVRKERSVESGGEALSTEDLQLLQELGYVEIEPGRQ